MSTQNITQQPTRNNQLPASMMPAKVSSHEIASLVSWITESRKVCYLEASMAIGDSVINAAIKLGLIAKLENDLVLSSFVELIGEHANVHLLQVANHVAECGFFEELPKPTNQEIALALFGDRRDLPRLTTKDKALAIRNTQNLHATIAADIRKDLAELEAKYGKQSQIEPQQFKQSQQQPQTEPQAKTQIFPIFKGLKLKNSDRANSDGYLLYVGNRADCVRAFDVCRKGAVKQNSKDGHSWKFILGLGQLPRRKRRGLQYQRGSDWTLNRDCDRRID
jgi:hypothetical protein